MSLLIGFVLVLLAALLQGTFVLPMTLVRQWSWEHTWATFSLLGMLVFNWIITLLLVPNISAVYAASPARDLEVLALFGLGWGVGAILFGLGMDRLGMALGYPIIMGLIASLGALIPLLLFFPHSLLTTKGLVLLAGTALVIFGIVLCSIGGSGRTPSEGKSAATHSSTFKVGLAIAILAGILSCLPNVGMAFGANVIDTAVKLGVSPASSGNTVWALLFTLGFVANLSYCLYQMISKRSLGQYWNRETPRNLGLSAAMARTFAENPALAKGVTVLFPDDVCDANSWHQFGTLGAHLMEGSWRTRGSHLRRRLGNLWEAWTMRRGLRESRANGKTRPLPTKPIAQPVEARC